MEYKRSSSGAGVIRIQVRLNLLLVPSPKLALDGIFDSRTEAAVIRFQRERNLFADGIVGSRTFQTLLAPPPAPAMPHLQKFLNELGVADDFIEHVARLESSVHSISDVMRGLGNFFNTLSGRRYLLVKRDRVGVIDFRHFFAAAVESYNSGRSRENGLALGSSPGMAELLGVANEINQCLGEAVSSRMNSCFSMEDLGSNRLGAEFGEWIKVREAENRPQPVSQHLRDYLRRLDPATPQEVGVMKAPGRWDTAIETLLAIGAGIHDLLISRAY